MAKYNPNNPAWKAKTPFETASAFRRLAVYSMRYYDKINGMIDETNSAREKYNGAFEEEMRALGSLSLARNSLMEAANYFNAAAELYAGGLLPRPDEEKAISLDAPADEPVTVSDEEEEDQIYVQ